jgi:hypothetical protein
MAKVYMVRSSKKKFIVEIIEILLKFNLMIQ